MKASELLATAMADQDWKDGLSYESNPFPKGTDEYRAWQREMNALLAEEMKREMMEPAL